MKQKLLNWWDRHSLQVYETLFLLSTIMVVGSLLLFIVFVAALGSGTSGGTYSMEAFVEFITGSWKELLISIVSGSVVGALTSAITTKGTVKKYLDEFANKLLAALNPDNRILHEDHDKMQAESRTSHDRIQSKLQSDHEKIQTGINAIEKRNISADAKFAALDKSTQSIMQNIEGFLRLVQDAASNEQQLRSRNTQLEKQCHLLEAENKVLREQAAKYDRSSTSAPDDDWEMEL